MKKIKQMKYYSLIRNIFKFEIFYKIIVLFCLSPILRWILQQYLHKVSVGILFNQDMFFQFLSWHGILVVFFLFLFMIFIIFYEMYVIMNIFLLEHQQVDYSLRKIMLKSFANLKSLHYPSLFLCGLYIVFLLPFVHVGFISSYILRWDVPQFIFNDLRMSMGGQLLIFICYIICYGVYLLMIFVPVFMCLKRQSIIQSTQESWSLWKKIKMKERMTILFSVLIWIIIDIFLMNHLKYPLLRNRDFSFYFLKYFITSTPFRYSVYQYILVWLLYITAMFIFLRYLVRLVNQYDQQMISVHEIPIDTDKMNQRIYQFEQFVQNIYKNIKEWILGSRFYQQNKIMSHMIIIGIVLCLFAFYLDQDAFMHQPWVIGHRGSAYEVENTLEAIKSANDCQADYAEIDIQLSQDEVPVVFHDGTLSRLSDSKAKVSDLTVAQLKQIELKEYGKTAYIVTLEELLEEMNRQNMSVRLLVEFKSSQQYQLLIEKTIEIVEQSQMSRRCIFMSSDFHIVKALKEKRPQWWIGYCIYGSVGDIDDAIWEMNIDFLAMEENRASTSFIQKAVSEMIPIYIWTVNDKKHMQQYLDMGVSGLITDYPDRGRELIDHYLDTHHQIYYYNESVY